MVVARFKVFWPVDGQVDKVPMVALVEHLAEQVERVEQVQFVVTPVSLRLILTILTFIVPMPLREKGITRGLRRT